MNGEQIRETDLDAIPVDRMAQLTQDIPYRLPGDIKEGLYDVEQAMVQDQPKAISEPSVSSQPAITQTADVAKQSKIKVPMDVYIQAKGMMDLGRVKEGQDFIGNWIKEHQKVQMKGPGGATQLEKLQNYRDRLVQSGIPETDARVKAVDKKLIGDSQTAEEKNFENYASKSGIDISTPSKYKKAYENWKTLVPQAYGAIRVEIAGLPRATTTPGVTYSPTKGYQEIQEDGTTKKLTSAEVKQKALEYKEEIPTTDLKTMQQSAPSVLELIKQAKADMQATRQYLGPGMSRWRLLWSGRIGTADVPFRKLQTDVGLLQTRLMRMHVGARGGQEMLKHFQTLFDAGKDAPENLEAAFDSVEMYAREVMKPLSEQRKGLIEIPKPKGLMSESDARKALSGKGIKGGAQDAWIKRYKDAGKVE